MRIGNYKKIFISIFLTVLLLTGLLYFSLNLNAETLNQKEIKIFPTSYTNSGWQNPEAIFSQDLGENASFEEFNTENSAYPASSQVGISNFSLDPELGTEGQFPIFEQITNSNVQNFKKLLIGYWKGIKDLFQGKVAKAEENTTSTSEVSSELNNEPESNQESVSEESATSTPNEETELTQEPISQESPTSTPVKEPTFPIQLEREEKTLEVFNFSVPNNLEKAQINNVQLRFSLAGKNNPLNNTNIELKDTNPKLVIEYQSKGEWQNLGEIEIGKEEISNATNGGYFLYALPVFENWQDLKNFKVKFSLVSWNTANQVSLGLVYLDAVWLEVDYQEIKKIKEKFLEFLIKDEIIRTIKNLDWYPEKFKSEEGEANNLGLNLRNALEFLPNQVEKQKLVLSGSCQKDYFVILIYTHPDDYIKEPNKFIYNKAFPCQKGSYYYELKDLPENLEDGIYYLMVAQQNRDEPWQPLTVIKPIEIITTYK
jgi:hypothetical protein